MRHQQGALLLEVVISLAIFTVLFGAVGSAMVADTNAHASIVRQIGPEMAATRVLDRITTELRGAGVWAEDLNQNGVLDDGEDMNVNGLLESDWSLSDGSTADSITFNHREDVVDSSTGQTYVGTYAPRTRYLLVDDEVVREQYGTNESGEDEIVARTVLARGVHSLVFARTGSLIRVRARVGIPQPGGTTRIRVFESQTWLRN